MPAASQRHSCCIPLKHGVPASRFIELIACRAGKDGCCHLAECDLAECVLVDCGLAEPGIVEYN